jgi:hypothetical protein
MTCSHTSAFSLENARTAITSEGPFLWTAIETNVISATEIFKDLGMTYFIVDDLPLTLEHLVACDSQR